MGLAQEWAIAERDPVWRSQGLDWTTHSFFGSLETRYKLTTDHLAVIEYRGTPDQITATCHQHIHRAILHTVHTSHYPYITDTSDRSRDPTTPLGPQAHCQERTSTGISASKHLT
jgi:hypothetical protein